MATIRAEVTTQLKLTDVPRDFQTNTVYYQSAGAPTDTQWQAIADAIKGVFYSTVGFGGSFPWTNFQGYGGRVVVYDMADPLPRPEKGVSLYTPSTWYSGSLADRSVALCLSYYSDRNLPRQRGRIYIGGWPSNTTNERPSTSSTSNLLDLAKGLYQLTTAGGMGIVHAIHSKRSGATLAVNHYWVNDVWDVQRSRSPKETNRYKFLP